MILTRTFKADIRVTASPAGTQNREIENENAHRSTSDAWPRASLSKMTFTTNFVVKITRKIIENHSPQNLYAPGSPEHVSRLNETQNLRKRSTRCITIKVQRKFEHTDERSSRLSRSTFSTSAQRFCRTDSCASRGAPKVTLLQTGEEWWRVASESLSSKTTDISWQMTHAHSVETTLPTKSGCVLATFPFQRG